MINPFKKKTNIKSNNAPKTGNVTNPNNNKETGNVTNPNNNKETGNVTNQLGNSPSSKSGKKNNWNEYQQNSLGRPPRDYLVNLIENLGTDRIKTALDLGCGGLSDAIYLAKHGIKTYGIDGNFDYQVLDYLNQQTQQIKDNIILIKQSFESLANIASQNSPLNLIENVERGNDYKKEVLNHPVDLIYSSVSLPFCDKEMLPGLFKFLFSSVNPNGFMLLHVFKEGHPFTDINNGGKATGFTQKQLENVFKLFGANTCMYETKSIQTQDGRILPNMKNIIITAQLPNKTPSVSIEQIENALFGVTQTKENPLNGGYQSAQNETANPSNISSEIKQASTFGDTSQSQFSVNTAQPQFSDMTTTKQNNMPLFDTFNHSLIVGGIDQERTPEE